MNSSIARHENRDDSALMRLLAGASVATLRMFMHTHRNFTAPIAKCIS